MEISLDTSSEHFDQVNFGKIPTFDELAKYVMIYNVNISILDDITSLEKLDKYLIDLTKYILNDVNKVAYKDMDNTIIFRFKCNHEKLGISKACDDTCGYVSKLNNSYVRIQSFNKAKKIPIEKIINNSID